ncbi:IPExxxVDY family protein [Salinimicrobium sediminilitoris]|uniref:IPExxxVDY family protein n=1 Tax=Salinimicrobium sediminilitoris TaxID=2876715 RepID=UPI001E56EDE4|nr:IPExxxVDY family protein [Salinimicrobium sediminilitoris]MCC8359432.1 IPExxxVDY family protein [Salinimicrobium sediminilitoris]
MPAHKLVLDEVFEQPYKLLAIHSSVEEFKLAYLLNKHIDLKLARTPKDIDLHKGKESILFAHFIYEDLQKYCTYHLVNNVARQEGRSGSDLDSLFFGDQLAVKKSFLLPEFKQVDFLVKIEDELDAISTKMLISRILEIPQVSTAYAIDFHRIKTKENLIFD